MTQDNVILVNLNGKERSVPTGCTIAGLLEEQLFAQKDATILTGATLTTEASFDYVRRTLGLEEANELALGSPFDYAESTKVLVPQNMPEPSQSGYLAALQSTLIDLVRASRGRALVLFTSHASLRAVHRGIRQALEDEQILVLGHNIDGSPRQLTHVFDTIGFINDLEPEHSFDRVL